MLPGVRFLFAAILLSTSILVFGLGAAALLRATHEQYVSNPSWRNGPQEQVFVQAPEPAQPVFAVLRAEPEAEVSTEPAPPSLRDRVPTIGLPTNESEQIAALPTEADKQPQVAETAPLPPEPVKAETVTDVPAPVIAEAPSPAETTASLPEATSAAPAASSEPAPADASAALAASALDVASAKLAALKAPAAAASKNPPAKAKAESTAADKKAAKRRAKAKKRHRVVRRPPPQQVQQQLDPFGQPQTFTTTTTARTR